MNLGWKHKLKNVILEMRNGSRPKSLSVPVIKEIVNAPSFEELSKYAAMLMNSGEIEIHYRVLSPDTKNPIAEFGYLYQVPPRVFDESSDSYFKINLIKDIEIVYSVSRA